MPRTVSGGHKPGNPPLPPTGSGRSSSPPAGRRETTTDLQQGHGSAGNARYGAPQTEDPVGQHDGKTEKATAQRRSKARKEGQIARSAEIGVACSLAVTGLVLKVFGPTAGHTLKREMSMLFAG